MNSPYRSGSVRHRIDSEIAQKKRAIAEAVNHNASLSELSRYLEEAKTFRSIHETATRLVMLCSEYSINPKTLVDEITQHMDELEGKPQRTNGKPAKVTSPPEMA